MTRLGQLINQFQAITGPDNRGVTIFELGKIFRQLSADNMIKIFAPGDSQINHREKLELVIKLAGNFFAAASQSHHFAQLLGIKIKNLIGLAPLTLLQDQASGLIMHS